MKKSRIAILMSIFDPDLLFLKEQLLSIQGQDYDSKFIKVFIRDDGSSNAVRSSIQHLVNEFDLLIDLEFGINLGPANSFRDLILKNELMEFDYIALSDQDDIWERDKLSFAIRQLEYHDNVPILFYSNASLIDADSRSLEGQLYSKLPSNETIFDMMMHSDIYGMAMIFNNKMLIQIQSAYPNLVTAHDHWIAILAYAVGEIIYTEKNLVKYRQHGNNVVGAITSEPSYFKIMIKHFKRINMLFSTLLRDSQVRTDESQWILEYYKDSVHENVVKELYMLIYSRKQMKYRVQLIRNKSYHGRNKLATFAIYFRTLLGHV